MSDILTPEFQQDVDAVSRIKEVNVILDVICKITNMGFAAVARVTKERWITCVSLDKVGFGLKSGDELKVDSTICYEIQSSRKPVVISYVARDPKYSDHHTPRQYGLQSYISVPIILEDNSFFGTLCAIDAAPADLDRSEILPMFQLYASMIAFHLDTMRKLVASERLLKEEKEIATLREQFIGILGHDLRNPLGAIRNSAQLIKRLPLPERGIKLSNIIIDSSFRISGLIENIMDFARAKLGDGIILEIDPAASLEKTLQQVIAEHAVLSPEKKVITQFALEHQIECDHKRLAQLFSNILGNAISYGKADTPIIVKAISDASGFHLAVSNQGEKIPEMKLKNLFEPFHRGGATQNKEGLGLGLYISAEIAKAHGGSLAVQSSDQETCFTLFIPCPSSV